MKPYRTLIELRDQVLLEFDPRLPEMMESAVTVEDHEMIERFVQNKQAGNIDEAERWVALFSLFKQGADEKVIAEALSYVAHDESLTPRLLSKMATVHD